MEPETTPFPIVDIEKVQELLREHKEIENNRSLLPAYESLPEEYYDRKKSVCEKINALILPKAQWLIDFLSTLPDGEWKAGTSADNDMFFAEVVAYQRLLHRVKDNNFDNLTGEISLYYISSENFDFEYRTGYDDGYPEIGTIGFPKELILNNEQADIEEKILRLAVEKCNRMEYSFQKKFQNCVACSDLLGIICEKKGIKLS